MIYGSNQENSCLISSTLRILTTLRQTQSVYFYYRYLKMIFLVKLWIFFYLFFYLATFNPASNGKPNLTLQLKSDPAGHARHIVLVVEEGGHVPRRRRYSCVPQHVALEKKQRSAAHRVRRSSVESASACCKAGSSSILDSAVGNPRRFFPLSRPAMRRWRGTSANDDG